MTIRNIIVPFDFSSYSELALATAFDVGQQLQADLHMVHVVGGELDAAAQGQVMDQLRAVVLPSQELELRVHREVLHGNVHEEVVTYAKHCKADLIVMGTRGRSGILRLALGSVAQRVLRSAPCPVMMVTPDIPKGESTLDLADAGYLHLKAADSPALDMLARAISLRASDIHIDPIDDEQYQVRLRIDGKVVSYCTLDRGVAEHLMHQYLTLARVDHAEPFRPREGRLQLPSTMHDIEVRVTASPVAGGEAIALRLFSKDNVFLPLDRLGFSSQGLTTVQRMLRGTEGLILVTGPTGSGKTTTVYSMLETYGGQNRNLVSIEDPVEFSVPFVRQLSVDERHGVSMSSGLRTVLRMDPDIIFIGEIRDPENAEIALRAASSGRFVFSSLHTRDVASTITALRDLDISNRSIAGNLVGVVNQRLVRTLCLKCRKPVAPSAECQETFADYQLEVPSKIFDSVGCEACRGSGFQGRCGVFESVVCDGEITEAIADNATEGEIRRIIRTQTACLTAESLRKVCDGITNFDEARSVRWL